MHFGSSVAYVSSGAVNEANASEVRDDFSVFRS